MAETLEPKGELEQQQEEAQEKVSTLDKASVKTVGDAKKAKKKAGAARGTKKGKAKGASGKKKKKGKRKKKKKKGPRCPIKRRKKPLKLKCLDMLLTTPILNTYYICHGVQDMLKLRKFTWKKKKGGK